MRLAKTFHECHNTLLSVEKKLNENFSVLREARFSNNLKTILREGQDDFEEYFSKYKDFREMGFTDEVIMNILGLSGEEAKEFLSKAKAELGDSAESKKSVDSDSGTGVVRMRKNLPSPAQEEDVYDEEEEKVVTGKVENKEQEKLAVNAKDEKDGVRKLRKFDPLKPYKYFTAHKQEKFLLIPEKQFLGGLLKEIRTLYSSGNVDSKSESKMKNKIESWLSENMQNSVREFNKNYKRVMEVMDKVTNKIMKEADEVVNRSSDLYSDRFVYNNLKQFFDENGADFENAVAGTAFVSGSNVVFIPYKEQKHKNSSLVKEGYDFGKPTSVTVDRLETFFRAVYDKINKLNEKLKKDSQRWTQSSKLSLRDVIYNFVGQQLQETFVAGESFEEWITNFFVVFSSGVKIVPEIPLEANGYREMLEFVVNPLSLKILIDGKPRTFDDLKSRYDVLNYMYENILYYYNQYYMLRVQKLFIDAFLGRMAGGMSKTYAGEATRNNFLERFHLAIKSLRETVVPALYVGYTGSEEECYYVSLDKFIGFTKEKMGKQLKEASRVPQIEQAGGFAPRAIVVFSRYFITHGGGKKVIKLFKDYYSGKKMGGDADYSKSILNGMFSYFSGSNYDYISLNRIKENIKFLYNSFNTDSAVVSVMAPVSVIYKQSEKFNLKATNSQSPSVNLGYMQEYFNKNFASNPRATEALQAFENAVNASKEIFDTVLVLSREFVNYVSTILKSLSLNTSADLATLRNELHRVYRGLDVSKEQEGMLKFYHQLGLEGQYRLTMSVLTDIINWIQDFQNNINNQKDDREKMELMNELKDNINMSIRTRITFMLIVKYYLNKNNLQLLRLSRSFYENFMKFVKFFEKDGSIRFDGGESDKKFSALKTAVVRIEDEMGAISYFSSDAAKGVYIHSKMPAVRDLTLYQISSDNS